MTAGGKTLGRVDYVGARFGRLVLIEELPLVLRISVSGRRYKARRFICRCDCGSEKEVALSNLKTNKRPIVSCGCARRAGRWTTKLSTRFTRHGERRGDSRSAEYVCWVSLKARCNNQNRADYHLCGGRGIRICDRWRESFEAFLADMGRKPSPGHSIDRINNDGDYEPGNCRWATAKEQRANQRARRASNAAHI